MLLVVCLRSSRGGDFSISLLCYRLQAAGRARRPRSPVEGNCTEALPLCYVYGLRVAELDRESESFELAESPHPLRLKEIMDMKVSPVTDPEHYFAVQSAISDSNDLHARAPSVGSCQSS